MTNLNDKDIQILKDGIKLQFHYWRCDDPHARYLIDDEHYMLNLVNKKKLPVDWQLDSNTMWNFEAALYSIYCKQSDLEKNNHYNYVSDEYHCPDIAKTAKKVTGESMQSIIEDTNIAWNDIE